MWGLSRWSSAIFRSANSLSLSWTNLGSSRLAAWETGEDTEPVVVHTGAAGETGPARLVQASRLVWADRSLDQVLNAPVDRLDELVEKAAAGMLVMGDGSAGTPPAGGQQGCMVVDS